MLFRKAHLSLGDSYVAVTGLPDPQEDHAIIMARFARDCRAKMKQVTRKLEMSLGPDTGELNMRFGLHSGPVTAGVLRVRGRNYARLLDRSDSYDSLSLVDREKNLGFNYLATRSILVSTSGHFCSVCFGTMYAIN